MGFLFAFLTIIAILINPSIVFGDPSIALIFLIISGLVVFKISLPKIPTNFLYIDEYVFFEASLNSLFSTLSNSVILYIYILK